MFDFAALEVVAFFAAALHGAALEVSARCDVAARFDGAALELPAFDVAALVAAREVDGIEVGLSKVAEGKDPDGWLAESEVDVEDVVVGEAAVGDIAILKCHAEMSAPESVGWSEVLTIVSEIEPLLPAFQPLRWIGAARDTT